MEIFGLLYRRVGEGERKGLMIGLCCWVESLIDIKNSGRFERASLYSFCWWGKVCKQKLCLVWLGDAPRIWHEKVPWWQEHVKLLKSTVIYQCFDVQHFFLDLLLCFLKVWHHDVDYEISSKLCLCLEMAKPLEVVLNAIFYILMMKVGKGS